MATEEHKCLSSIIKQTHASLREECRNYGAEIAWKRHVSREDVLQKYADSMQKLALTHWQSERIDVKGEKRICRMKWIVAQCKEYFHNGGKEKYFARELDIKKKLDENKNINENPIAQLSNSNEKDADKLQGKIALLDVGSCFNPFELESAFETTAIDLFPIPGKVFKCDFVTINIGKERVLSQNLQEIYQLPENSFDAVAFALFLEYLPCPELRYICCKKAYDLLRNEGILLIISPDSKHVGANAKIMKSWRYVLSKLGFMRIKYEKFPHIHCLVFRKCVFREVAVRWAAMQNVVEDDPLYTSNKKIFIPQDFHSSSVKTIKNDIDRSDDDLLETFNELPFIED